MRKILLTGGLGYIGSHTALSLIKAGYKPIIVDNLSNSKISVKSALEKITGKSITFVECDCGDRKAINSVFDEYGPFYAVIHFAGYKAVGESVKLPFKYYQNNLESAIETVGAALSHSCNRFIFSSSATVYGLSQKMPLKEDAPLSYTQPYGETKLVIENMLRGIAKANPDFKTVLLRYFNPVGADESGLIGEDPNGIPNNLMPYITRVATGRLECLTIFGNDYPTPDGTCVRDFIHVSDLADGHTAALSHIDSLESNCMAINLGTGRGVSVKELVDTFNECTGGLCKVKWGERRPGDVPVSYADATLAHKLLGWTAKKSVKDMCLSAYEYERKSCK